MFTRYSTLYKTQESIGWSRSDWIWGLALVKAGALELLKHLSQPMAEAVDILLTASRKSNRFQAKHIFSKSIRRNPTVPWPSQNVWRTLLSAPLSVVRLQAPQLRLLRLFEALEPCPQARKTRKTRKTGPVDLTRFWEDLLVFWA